MTRLLVFLTPRPAKTEPKTDSQNKSRGCKSSEGLLFTSTETTRNEKKAAGDRMVYQKQEGR
jgi:hypothetical protein